MRLGRRVITGLILGALAAFLISLVRPRRLPAHPTPEAQPEPAPAPLTDTVDLDDPDQVEAQDVELTEQVPAPTPGEATR